MKKLEVITRPEKLEPLVDAFESFGHSGMNITDVRGHGRQKGMVELFRWKEYEVKFVSKVKIEIVLEDSRIEQALDIVQSITKTGTIGDGKIFISNVEEVIRIRTGERGEQAI